MKITLSAVAALAFLAVALVSGNVARAELIRKPRPAEISAATAQGLAQRWERDSAGTIFPAKIAYGTDLLTNETATRVGIGTTDTCAAALDNTLTSLAARYGCRAVVRASYIDALDGVVYTVGVLAFPDPTASARFYNQMPGARFPATGLRALALAGTPAARFDDAARQASAAQHTGPYVLLAVAGYADGRSASSTGERRPSAFSPAGQLLTVVTGPLRQVEVPNCQNKSEWSC